MSDQLPPNITHAFEQYTAFARDFAGVAAIYFRALLGQGFTREEALCLTVNWQRDTLDRLLTPRKA